MKSKSLLSLGMALLCFAACKKENSVTDPPIEKSHKAEIIRDSVSYIIDGKLYTASKYSSFWKHANLQPNSKVDSIIKNAYYISGDKDSIMYSETFSIYNDHQSINFTFIKKYNKNAMTTTILRQPNDMKDFYEIGGRNYALDYERDNSQNGIAIDLSDQGFFKTYGSYSFRTPPTLSADAHKNSKFEIVSLKANKSGLYILEAKFNTTVFDDKKGSKSIDNGYLRINLGLLK